MRRCPVCHGINPDPVHYCRHCNYYLRRHLPEPLDPPRAWPMVLLIWLLHLPWARLILSSAILGVVGLTGYWGWIWIQPMLDHPPVPQFEPAMSGIEQHLVAEPDQPAPAADSSPAQVN